MVLSKFKAKTDLNWKVADANIMIWRQVYDKTIITDPCLSNNHTNISKIQGMHDEIRIWELGFPFFG